MGPSGVGAGLQTTRAPKTFDAYDNPSSGTFATSCCVSNGSPWVAVGPWLRKPVQTCSPGGHSNKQVDHVRERKRGKLHHGRAVDESADRL